MNIQHKLLTRAIRESLLRGMLWATVISAALAGGSLCAAEEADESELRLEEQTVIKSEVEVGIGHVSDASWRFGRYTGLKDDGLFPIVNLDIYKRADWNSGDGSYWRLSGRNLGIESRELALEFGNQGKYDIRLGFDEIPHYQYNDGQTIFQGAGSTNLTLPAGWVAGQTTATMTQLLPSLHGVGIEHGRKRFDASGDFVLPSGWSAEVTYQREIKDGNKTIGLTIGNSGGNPRAVIAPEPIDYETQQIEAKLHFADQTRQLSIGYYVSLFDNDNNSLIWQNPFATINGWTTTAAVGYPTGQGQMGLAPDNQFHQINVSGGWNFTSTMRLSGEVGVGRTTQNDEFLPYTINPLLAATITQPLPVDSLDGELDMTYVGLRFSAQPLDNLTLGATYKFDDRDNKTHHHEYVYIGGDSLAQNVAATSSQRRYNEPKSYRMENLRFDAVWRAADFLRVQGEAQFSDIERPYQERERIKEDRYALNFAVDANEYLSGGLRLTQADRDGGSEYLGYETFIGGYAPGYYNTVLPFVGGFPFENHPDLRKFNQADRVRRNGEVYANLMIGEEVALSGSVDYSEDDYDNSIKGLTFSRVSSYNVDVTWAPREQTSVYAFAAEERYKNDQDGSSFGGATRGVQIYDPARAWTVKSRDHVFTYGFGFNTRWLEDKLTVGMDYANSKADSDVLTIVGSGLTRANLPTAESDLESASLYADYKFRRDLSFRLRFAYEDYASSDWALDNAPANQLANVITLGEGSQDYTVWVTSFTLGYRF